MSISENLYLLREQSEKRKGNLPPSGQEVVLLLSWDQNKNPLLLRLPPFLNKGQELVVYPALQVA